MDAFLAHTSRGVSCGGGLRVRSPVAARLSAREGSRRTEAAFLARLVAEHRIPEDRAAEIIVDIVDTAPRRAFKL